MKRFLIGAALAAALLVPASVATAAPACVVGGSIVYCDTFHRGHTLAQMQTACREFNPNSHEYAFYNCDYWLAQ